MNPIITDNLEAIVALCRKHRVRSLFVFGSAVRDDFDPDRSDLDFCVEFQPRQHQGFDDVYFKLLLDLEDLFDRRIDLIERPVIEQSRNRFRKRAILSTLEPLYAAA